MLPEHEGHSKAIMQGSQSSYFGTLKTRGRVTWRVVSGVQANTTPFFPVAIGGDSRLLLREKF